MHNRTRLLKGIEPIISYCWMLKKLNYSPVKYILNHHFPMNGFSMFTLDFS